LVVCLIFLSTVKENFLFSYGKNLNYRIKSLNKYVKKHKLYENNNKKLDIINQIYCINLIHNSKRRNYIKKQLIEQSIDIPFKFFQAIYGKYLQESTINNNTITYLYNRLNFDQKINLPKHNNSKNELGCLLSHLLVISEFIKSDQNYCLIVEDDVYFGIIPLWNINLKTVIEHAPLDWEIINLYSEISKNTKDTYIDSKQNQSWGTVAYIVNKNIKHTFNQYINITPQNISLNIPIKILDSIDADISADILFRNIFKSYSYKPDLFMPFNTNISSTLHDEHTNYFIELQNAILKRFDPLIKYIA